jgi:hypothetical protein
MLFRPKRAPRYLYKFVSSNTAALILKGHSVSFTAFRALNDPFECFATLMDPPRWAAIFAYSAVKEGSAVLPDEIHEWQKDDWRELEDRFQKVRAELETIGVFCLTEDAKNLLMWAHYAKAHTGFVLRFELESLLGWDRAHRVPTSELGLVPGLERVLYANRPPIIFGGRLESTVRKALLTKSTPWRYEREWRMFRTIAAGSERSVVSLPHDCLDGVIIGAHVKKSDRDDMHSRVKELNKCRPTQLEIFDAKLSLTSYAVELMPIAI